MLFQKSFLKWLCEKHQTFCVQKSQYRPSISCKCRQTINAESKWEIWRKKGSETNEKRIGPQFEKKNKAKPRRTAKQREQFINKVKKREKIENDTQSNKRKRKTKLLWWKKGSRYIGIKCNAWLCKLLSFILRLFFFLSFTRRQKKQQQQR